MDWVEEMSERLNLYAQVQAVAAKMKAEVKAAGSMAPAAVVEQSRQSGGKTKKA